MTRNGVDVVRRRILLDDFVKVEEATLRYRRFDGQMSDEVRRLSVDRGNSVAVILLDSDTQEVILVEQFKWPTYDDDGGWIVETVAGVVSDGEDPMKAAERETLEETGYAFADLRFIARFYLSPGGSTEQIFLYYGEVSESTKVTLGGGLAEEGEDIRPRRYSLTEAEAAVGSGEIIDAKTIIAVGWVLTYLATR
jgi:nudix-type nucleoside diphosphatase (YffH/AdpP family)